MNKAYLVAAALVAAALPAAASTTKPLPPLPTPYTQVAAPADPDHFSFIVAGDNRSTGHGYPMPPCFEEICKEIGLIRPPFVLWTGDDIEGYGDTPAEANGEYDVFLNTVAEAGVPVFNCPGNHEFGLDPDLLPVYLKRMGPLYGSFDYGNSHFICLDTTSVAPDGSVKTGTLDDSQWSWLESDLQSNQGAKNIFVFFHHYLFGPPQDDPTLDSGWDSKADRDRLHAMMVKYHVRAVFTGHNHIYWHAVKDGVDYFISGGAGAPLDAPPDQGGFLHYIVVTVDGASISTKILQPWHLDVAYTTDLTAATGSETALASNTNFDEVNASGIPITVAAPPAGQSLVVSALMRYKAKTKSAVASIVSVTPSADGKTDLVLVAATLIHARTTEITVSSAPKGAGN